MTLSLLTKTSLIGALTAMTLTTLSAAPVAAQYAVLASHLHTFP